MQKGSDAAGRAAKRNDVVKQNTETAKSWSVLTVAAGTYLGHVAVKLDAAQDAFVLGVFRQIEGTIKLADGFGITTESVVAFTRQAKRLNIEASVIESGFAALNRQLGAVDFGSKDAADAFARLGLDGRELSSLTLDKAFLRIADAVGAISDPTRKAAAIVGIFGDKAAAITPLLQNGRKGFDEAAKQVEATGESFSRLGGEKVTYAAATLTQLGEKIRGVLTQALIQVYPLIMGIVGAMTEGGASGEKMGDQIAAGIKSAALGIAHVLDKLTSLSLKFKQTMLEIKVISERGSQELAERIVQNGDTTFGFENVGGKRRRLVKEARDVESAARRAEGLIVNPNLGEGDAAQNLANLRDMGKAAQVDLAAVRKELEDLANAPTNADAVNRFFDTVKTKSDEVAKQRIFDKTGGGSLPLINRWLEQFQKGTELASSLKNPLEVFNESLDRNQKLFFTGAINADVYARATGRAVDELERANNLQPVRRAAALDRNSSAAVNAQNQFDAERKADRQRLDPQERIAQILADAKLIQDAQRILQEGILAAIKGQAKVVEAKVP